MGDNDNYKEEKYLENYPVPVTSESTEIILSQMKKCVCKIYVDNGNKGTGFFAKIYDPNKNHLISVLVTNNHIIDEKHLGKNQYIEFTINNDIIKNKILIGDRKTYTSKKYDTTIIEIYENKDGINNFLELDFDLYEEDFNNKYIGKSIYILQYPKHEKVYVSYGIIRSREANIEFRHKICHYCSTDHGSSGAPILNISTNRIIGIHCGTYEIFNKNEGILLYFPFQEFISQKTKISIKISKPVETVKMSLKNTLKDLRMQPNLPHSTIKRIGVEIKNSKDYEGFQILGFIDDKVHGVLEGPPGTIFENGFFQFMIIYPKEYPSKIPKFYFQTKMFHPNIEETGYVSIDTSEWGPNVQISHIILSMQLLLDEPNLDSFVNDNIEALYIGNKSEYEKEVKKYTSQYANFDTVQKELAKLNFHMVLNN